MNTQTQAEAKDLQPATSPDSNTAQTDDIFFGRKQQRREKARQQSRTWLIEAVQLADKGEAFDELFLTAFASHH